MQQSQVIQTEALAVEVASAPGRVALNTAVFLPHEAAEVGRALLEAAHNASRAAAETIEGLR